MSEGVKNKYVIKYSRHEEEAAGGRGQYVSSVHVQHYNDVLWTACQAWMTRRERHEDDLKVLKKGKIPKNYSIAFRISKQRKEQHGKEDNDGGNEQTQESVVQAT